MSILIRYGVANQVSKSLSEFPTVSSILGHTGLQQFLGYSSNVEGRVNNVANIENLSEGDEVDIVSKSNTKG